MCLVISKPRKECVYEREREKVASRDFYNVTKVIRHTAGRRRRRRGPLTE